jgi:Raf kinase inhibitor-like YbhB/YbcL family protein
MKKLILITTLFLSTVVNGQTFTLKSHELGGQGTLKQALDGHGCEGENTSPELYWENVPAGTKSFAVVMYDENAPTGSGWWHWLIFDIDKSITELKSNSGNTKKNIAPVNSIQSKTDFGFPGYGGPCPPPAHGFHRYVITVYALKKEKLGLDANANPALVGFYLEQNVIEKASMIFYYKK